MIRRPLAARCALALAAATTALPARADETGADKAAAQALFDQAKELLARGNVLEACPKLEESQKLDPTSGTLINLADCYERQGRLATAWSTFLQAAATARTAGHLEREQVARDRSTALGLRLPKIVIQVIAGDIPGFDIRRDGASVGKPQWGMAIPADPGPHRIVAVAAGRRAWETTVTLRGEGETATVTVPGLDPLPMAAPSEPSEGLGTHRTLALVAGGVGVAGLAVGAVFGLSSISKHDEAEHHCSGSICRDEQGVELRAQATRAGNASTAAFLVGAAGLVGGAALWLTAKPDATTGARPAIGVGLGTVVVTQRW